MTAFESLTPEALLKEVAAHIRNVAERSTYKGAKPELLVLARELEDAGILPAESPFRDKPAWPVGSPEDAARAVVKLESSKIPTLPEFVAAVDWGFIDVTRKGQREMNKK